MQCCDCYLPLGVEAALAAIETRESDNAEIRRQAELALTQARYEADLAQRQYDAVDPANRLVAAELERRWNDRLAEVRAAGGAARRPLRPPVRRHRHARRNSA